MNKLKHQAPKGYRINTFNHIELSGDYGYCSSHNFVFSPEAEQEKLYNAKPCIYTDGRYKMGKNFFHQAYLYDKRYEDISLKSCVRRTLNCRNIPVGTVVKFAKSWYIPGKKT